MDTANFHSLLINTTTYFHLYFFLQKSTIPIIDKISDVWMLQIHSMEFYKFIQWNLSFGTFLFICCCNYCQVYPPTYPPFQAWPPSFYIFSSHLHFSPAQPDLLHTKSAHGTTASSSSSHLQPSPHFPSSSHHIQSHWATTPWPLLPWIYMQVIGHRSQQCHPPIVSLLCTPSLSSYPSTLDFQQEGHQQPTVQPGCLGGQQSLLHSEQFHNWGHGQVVGAQAQRWVSRVFSPDPGSAPPHPAHSGHASKCDDWLD